MNKDQGSGIIERVIYGAVMFLVVRYGASLGLSESDAAWLAGGIVALGGGAYGWWHNRPVSVLNRAGDAIPPAARLVIETPISAPHSQRVEAAQLANAASDKVIAKT